MSIIDWITILAILAGPILAVQAQSWVDRRRSKQDRKLQIFRTLMSQRATRLSSQYVDALNLIDIEFHSDKGITDKWKELLDHFGSGPKKEDYPDSTQFKTLLDIWSKKQQDLIAELLALMANRLGFKFDKVHIAKGVYNPQAHDQARIEQTLIRLKMLELLNGKISLQVSPMISDDEVQEIKQLRQNLTSVLKGEQGIKIDTPQVPLQ